MANNINGINGYGNYGLGGYGPQKRGNDDANAAKNEGQAVVNNYEETQVDPSKVMDFLANNNYFVDMVKVPNPVAGVEPDPTLADRIDGFMQNFEAIYAVVEQEFGPELAPMVMDFSMDKLMGMVD